MTNLLPNQRAETEDQTPRPMEKIQSCTFHHTMTPECHDQHLSGETQKPDDVEKRITMNPFENVAFAVEFARVDLVEQGHQNESVEDQGELFAR